MLGVRTFDSLRLYRNFRLYLLGQTVAGTGAWLQTAARSWLVLGLTHSAVAVGFVMFWQYGPYALFGLVGGSISDRFDYRRTLFVTQGLLMACAAVLALLTLAHRVDVAAVYAMSAATGLIGVVDTPSRQALTVQMVGREELGNAIALNAGVLNATRVVGPALAGLLIAGVGVGICFGLNALSYLGVIAALWAMRPTEFAPMERSSAHASVWRALREGLSYARRVADVRLPLLALAVVSVLAINWSVLLPVLARQTLHQGAGVYGFITSLFGVGALTGALLAASARRLHWPHLLASGLAFGVCELVLAPERSVWAAAACLVVTGAAYTLYTSATNTMVQVASPDAMQARVAGLYSYVFLGTAPLGALIVGHLSQRGGTALAFFVGGGATLITLGTVALSLRARHGARAALDAGPTAGVGPP